MSESDFLLALIVMSAAAIATRLAGAMLMARFTLSPKLERFLDNVSVSVIAALVASILVSSGPQIAIAVVIASLVALATSSTVWAMLAGLLVAAMSMAL